MIAAFEAASMLGTGGRNLTLVGGVEIMSRIQIGLDQRLSAKKDSQLEWGLTRPPTNQIRGLGLRTVTCNSTTQP